MQFRSIRFKLTLWYVLILGILLISFSTFLYFTLSRTLYRDVDDRLRSLAELTASESASPFSKFGFNDIDKALESSMNLKPMGKFIQVLDESGNIGRKSDNLKNVHLPISLSALKNASRGLTTLETSRFQDTPLRILTLPVVEAGRVAHIIQVASSLENVDDALNNLLIILIITVPFALLIASLGGQFLASKALKPVDNITQTARAITSQNLNQRIAPLKVKDEISRLVETFNEMISRLGQSFRQTKQFSSDASHELKTPLTILKGEMEVALRKERPLSEYQETLKSNLEEVNRMSKIVEDLLLLSNADSGEISLNKRNIDLSEILREVVAQLSILAHEKKIRIETSNHSDGIRIMGDPLRIRALFLNLVENGIKYTEEGGVISVVLKKRVIPRDDPLSDTEGFAEIVFSDTGIGITKEDQQRIFDRFYRVDKARSRDQGGSGLGLSICKWIVEAHQGQIRVESELGKGSSFIVLLPLWQ